MLLRISVVFFLIIIGIFISGCTEQAQTVDQGKLIGSWQNQENKDITISFTNESAVAVSPLFGCWVLIKMGKQPPDFNCEFFEMNKGIWNHNTKSSRVTFSIFNIEILNKTHQDPNSYYAVINGTLHGTCPSVNLQCSSLYNVTIPFEYIPSTEKLNSSEFPSFNFIRISSSNIT